MNVKVKKVIGDILESFKTKDIPQFVAYAMFPIPEIPSSKWSLMNRLAMLLSGTQDARGMKQWNSVNRYVKKGSKAIYILVPWIKKTDDEEGNENKSKNTGKGADGEEQKSLVGFMARAVFRYEDTDGEEIDYMDVQLPKFPLSEKAEEWGIKVIPTMNTQSYYGYYAPQIKTIALATPEEKTFFHELSHVAHEKIIGDLGRGQVPSQEIVAEFSAQALCRLVGKTDDKHMASSYYYIEEYAKEMKLTAHSACLKLICEIEKVLHLILDIHPAN